MHSMAKLQATLLAAAACLSAQTVGARIDTILQSPAAQQAIWGIHVVDLQTGRIVYAKNPEQLFIPASNTKLFSTALVLTRLGPDYRFRTLITAPEPIDSNGRVSGLRFVGGGDPNLSGRIVPYQYESDWGEPLRYVHQFAERLASAGLKHVDGDVVGDDSAYAREPFPEGWALDDPIYDYGAPVSALLINDGAFTLRVAPSSPGQPPRIDSIPVISGMVLHNRATTGTTTELKFQRLPGTSELTVTGTVAKHREALLAMEDPALFAAEALREALMKRGIRVSGVARTEHFPAPGVALMTHESQPLIESLRVINKESVNLHAELVLLEAARAHYGTASRDIALDELKVFLKQIGIADNQHHFEDGSGLSRRTLVTPVAITRLLVYMHQSPNREAWLSTLPIGGKDGTLGKRFTKAPAAAGILAKTGSVSHVNALSGYAGRYAFSILVNNTNRPAARVRRVMDQVALALLK